MTLGLVHAIVQIVNYSLPKWQAVQLTLNPAGGGGGGGSRVPAAHPHPEIPKVPPQTPPGLSMHPNIVNQPARH